jgi:hypothetical protein
MLDRWNAHDIEGYMQVYWKSPELLVVVDAEQLMAGSNFMTRYLGDESARLRFIREAVQRRASVTQMLRRSSTWESRRRWLLDWARFTNGIWSTGISSQQTSW